MQYVKWQALNTMDFGLFHTSVRFSERPADFIVDHTKKGRGTSGILFVTGGSLTFVQEGLPELTVGEKALCLLPQNCHYSLRFCGKQNGQLLLNFTLISAQGEVILPGDRVELLMPTVTDPKLLHYFDMLLHQVSTGKSDSAFLHKEQLYRLFTLLFGEKSIDHPLQTKYSNLAPGVHLLQQTFLQDLPIQQFADICNISLSSFRSLFTEFYGISPLRYRNQLRINHAKTLLTETHCTISEVAERSGFDNTAYFCRLYKKNIGETPGQTRARHWE